MVRLPAERPSEHRVSDMLAEIMWQSAFLVGAGLIGGLAFGFSLYPLLFRRPTGIHRKAGAERQWRP